MDRTMQGRTGKRVVSGDSHETGAARFGVDPGPLIDPPLETPQLPGTFC